MSHYTLGAHQTHVSQQYISDLLLVNHIITPHYTTIEIYYALFRSSMTLVVLPY